ncbi:hypothetical protein EH223_14840 [candidate division KSB1 bacterium]|nr:hypothetical protein [candidate division KSB1 bacterium]RQW01442.1 MAG: hypothetical protein EH223_14840 [candidate division KSB1 bacterium]
MIPYGKMFSVGEVILVYIDNEPGFFARIESITPDHKKNWWQMTFLILSIPLKTMTWILDDEQMRGQSFTMNSVPMQIKKVEAPNAEHLRDPQSRTAEESKPKGEGGNVISMFDEE